MNFEDFNLAPSLLQGVEDLGFKKPTEIQEGAIPLLLDHQGDFVGQAQTGTGKTMAFLLPLLERLNLESSDVGALIVAPTRELAQQVYRELEKVTKYIEVHGMTVYGGVPYEKQIRALKKKNAHIVVGTPGRIIDLMERGVLKLGHCHHLILDEADEMLNMGFLEDVQKIVQSLPRERKIWMFSATMPKPISDLVMREFQNPQFLKIKKKNLTNDNISQYYSILNRKDFIKGLRMIIESQRESYGIIFCETRQESKQVAEGLIDYGISALALNGDLSQSQRDFTMARFKSKKVRFLVCTDIAARGIDVDHVGHVFNMGFPRQTQSYVHRVGRTGRAGESGVAVTFVSPAAKYDIKKVERMTGQKIIEYELPSLQQLKKVKVESELEKMAKLKQAVQSLGQEFSLDPSYGDFESFFSSLEREEILKLIFSYKFNRDFRLIEEGLNISPLALKRETKRRKNRRSRGEHSRGGGSQKSFPKTKRGQGVRKSSKGRSRRSDSRTSSY